MRRFSSSARLSIYPPVAKNLTSDSSPHFFSSRCVNKVGDPPNAPTPTNLPFRSAGVFTSGAAITVNVKELRSPMIMIGSAPSIRALTGVVPDKLAASVSPAKMSWTWREADCRPRSSTLSPYLENRPASRAAQSGSCAEPKLTDMRNGLSSCPSAARNNGYNSAQINAEQIFHSLWPNTRAPQRLLGNSKLRKEFFGPRVQRYSQAAESSCRRLTAKSV